MNTRIKNQLIKDLCDKIEDNDELSSDFTYLDQFHNRWNLSEQSKVDLSKLSSKMIALLEDEDDDKLARAVKSYSNLLKKGDTKIIKRLQDIPVALKGFLSGSDSKILYKEDRNGDLLPYVITNCTFNQARNSHDTSNTCINLRYNTYKKEETQNIYFHDSDLNNKTIGELLDAKGYILEFEDINEIYETSYKRFAANKNQLGKQMVAKGFAEELTKSNNYWRTRNVKLDSGDYQCKVVIDDAMEIDSDDTSPKPYYHSMYFGGNVKIPFHLYIPVFDLFKHKFYLVHINNLADYQYNPEVMDKLVLDQEIKDLISILVSSDGDLMEDIIQGKTGGKIVISTGPPGVGKTLTAECYSEIIERPIYKVQCSQLGLSINDLEKNLQAILARASKWQAILLIDEADVYIRKRGDDIHQNAVVGVFLRILEYYSGVLFMTSNLGDSIDDAIMSRATAHIAYPMPTKEERMDIAKILMNQFDINEDVEILAFFEDTELSGRDIKAILKLAKFLSKDKDVDIRHIETSKKYIYTTQ